MTLTQKILFVGIATLVTILIRALPFLIFHGDRKIPPFVTWTGNNLPRAAMAMLVIYCLKDVTFTFMSAWLPAIVGVAVTVILHTRFRQMILSICGGTLTYMILLRVLA